MGALMDAKGEDQDEYPEQNEYYIWAHSYSLSNRNLTARWHTFHWSESARLGESMKRIWLLVAIWTMSLGPVAAAQNYGSARPEWTTAIEPFRITDNIYYVGSKDLAAYLIVTSAGDILINSNLVSSPPQILASIRKLGMKPSDVKILLISHAHFDHDAGSAELKRAAGAKYMVMDADVAVVESGGGKDFAYPGDRYPAAKV